MRTGKSSARNALRFSLLGVAMLAMIQQGTMAKAAPLDPTGILPSPVAGSTILARLVEPDATTKARVVEAYGKLPLSFEANRGQTDSQVRYLARGPGYTFFLTPTEAVMALKNRQPARSDESQETGEPGRSMMRMKLVGGNPNPQITGSDPLPGTSNYFIGNDPKKWRTNIPHYRKVHYHTVYPGIDLVFYGNPRQLQYDFIIAPGADPETITLAFEGTDRLEIDAAGNLILHIPGGQVIQHPPIIYQEIDGVRQAIPGGYVARGTHQVAFNVAEHDPSLPLIIDPVLVYSTYLGSAGTERGNAIAVDATGNAYVTGETDSDGFPGTAGSAIQAARGGLTDAFVTKLNAEGSAIVYSTYLGGAGTDRGLGIAVDGTNNAYITGVTDSDNFPTENAFQGAREGLTDAFVTKINAAGSALLYSSYLGGSLDDQGNAIAVDSGDNVYVTGWTESGGATAFPTTGGSFDETFKGVRDAFVSKFDPTQVIAADTLVYSTFLGGTESDEGRGIAVDAALRAYVTGVTDSGAVTPFPTSVGAFDTTGNGGTDAFVTRLDNAGATLEYSTFLGGAQDDRGNDITVDTGNNAYVTGETGSADFPTTVGAFNTILGTIPDAFVTKVNATGSALVYSTYLGGNGTDRGFGIALDGVGNAYVTGETGSTNFPTSGSPFQAVLSVAPDAFVTKLNATGTALVYSSYLGGSQNDIGHAIAVDPLDNAYVTGETASGGAVVTPFPTTAGAFDTTFNDIIDAFVAKVMESADAPVNGNGEGSSGCFIATAAFGSPLAPQVQVLREFRDRHLLTNAAGRLVTTAYYRISPPLAEVVARSKPLRSVVRAGLTPVIGWTELFMWSPVLGFAISLAFLGFGSRVALAAARRYRSRK